MRSTRLSGSLGILVCSFPAPVLGFQFKLSLTYAHSKLKAKRQKLLRPMLWRCRSFRSDRTLEHPFFCHSTLLRSVALLSGVRLAVWFTKSPRSLIRGIYSCPQSFVNFAGLAAQRAKEEVEEDEDEDFAEEEPEEEEAGEEEAEEEEEVFSFASLDTDGVSPKFGSLALVGVATAPSFLTLHLFKCLPDSICILADPIHLIWNVLPSDETHQSLLHCAGPQEEEGCCQAQGREACKEGSQGREVHQEGSQG